MSIWKKSLIGCLTYALFLLILLQILVILGTVQTLRGDEWGDVYERESYRVRDRDTGESHRVDVIRRPDYWDDNDDCDPQPDYDSPVAEEIRKENYKDWLRTYDVEEGLLVW
jgi:hypothetical protein